MDQLIDNYKAASANLFNYIPTSPYRGKVTLFKATEPEPFDSNIPKEELRILKRLHEIAENKPDNGLGDFTYDLRIIKIADTHDGIVRGASIKYAASFVL